MKREVTPGQQQVLQYIQQTIRDSGNAPTLQELASEFGKSTGAIQTALQSLRTKGLIEIIPNKSRGIRLTEQSAMQDLCVTELRAALEAALEDSNDLPTLFRTAQENLPKVFRMEAGILWAKDAARRRFLGPRDFGLEPPAAFEFRDELPLKFQGRTAPLWIMDRTKVAETPILAAFDPRAKSVLAIPVMDGQRFLGLLAFASARISKGTGNDETIEAARAASSLLVAPLRRAAAQFGLQEDLRLHQLLLTLVKQLASDLDLESLLHRIFKIIEKLVPVDAMFIALRRKDGLYETLLETDLDDQGRRIFVPGPRVMESDRSKMMETVEQKRYALIHRSAEDLHRMSGRKPSGDPWYAVGNPNRRSASLLFIPIWFGDEFRGALSVQSYTLNAYRHQDAERMLVIGEYIGLAIRNARLIDQLRKKSK